MNYFRQISWILLGIAFLSPSVAWSQQLTITSPVAGTVVTPDQTIVVTVSVSAGSVSGVLVAAQDIGATPLQTTAPYSFSLTIPQGIAGLKNLTAFGVTGPEQVVTSVPVQIDIEPTAQATTLTVNLQQVQFGFAGDQFPLGATATFADGSQIDVTQSTQVSFSTADATVATVDSTGLVTATGAGTTQISIKYAGQLTSVQATVPPKVVGDLNSDGKVTADDMRILQAFVGMNAVGTFDARDLNGDGIINASDVQVLQTLCGSACSNIVSITTTLLSSSVNPSVLGQSVALSATVSSAGTTTPTGSLVFFDGATQSGSGNLDGTGTSGFQISTLAVGTHAIFVKYGGDPNSKSSTSANLMQIVNGFQTSTALTSSLNPSVVGQSVTLTATVSGTGGTPTGSVTFYDGATALGAGGLTLGKATLLISTFAIGSHSITAQYGGDSSFAGSTSSPALVQLVNGKSSATTLGSSLNPEVAGQSVTFTATVTSTAGGTPTGTVTFLNGATSLGTGVLNTSGVATYATTALAVGTQSITARYGGDASYAASTSATVTETVNVAGFGPVSSVPPVTAGQSTVVNLTVYAASGSNLNFTLSCLGAPAKSSCSFNQNPAAGAPPPTGMAIQMNFSTSSSNLPASPENRSPWPLGLHGVYVVLVALSTVSAIGFKYAPRHRPALGLCLAVVVVATVLVGCASGNGSGSIPTYTGTPKGTATITVTGTSGTTAISTPVVITVQ